MNIKDAIIIKPWGHEYMVFENKDLSIWLLKINKNQKTSLHCHPQKKTGLILLENKAQISLMDRSFETTALSKIMIRKECFHQTSALDEDIVLLEVETPKDKDDLVRIEDSYGRKNEGYEKQNKWQKRSENDLFIENIENKIYKYNKYNFYIQNLSLENLSKQKPEDLIIVLNNYAFNNNRHDFCSFGEVLHIKTALFLAKEYNINENIKVMIISNETT